MDLNELEVKFFKALAHPIRIKIVKKLLFGELCVCDLNDDIDFSQSNLSQHLKILKDARIVTSRKEGLKVHYSIENLEKIRKSFQLIEELIRETWDIKF
ncbi:ArsR family transcriptional regulator [Hypnocyclicus thermotrophus]|uniref:ArsR family transcriptional regulator n=1 Tax=Hypnocyclicus thermotrophus TaxID=1627895 RepID=A0AA46I5D5_9FUSO|nr:metalloregulator ArsR/SmtB family transcription factor [Hypnocyclicus thermotrophus]TDT69228.1 ArsR family transcriptional regulator [Hypnocyclicus thermotrophus]